MSEYSEKFWKSNWDEGLDDLDPKSWESIGSLVDAYNNSFKDYPQNIALKLMGAEITYDELDEFTNQFAHMLTANGFKKGDIVAIHLPNIPDYIIAMVGAHKAGCIVSGLSPLLSPSQLEYRLKYLDAGDKKIALLTLDLFLSSHVHEFYSKIEHLDLIITTSISGFLPFYKKFVGKLIGRFPKSKPGLPGLIQSILPGKTTPIISDAVIIDFHKQVIKDFNTTPVDIKVEGEDVAFIQFTGGASAEPRGAMLTHSNILSDILIVQKWIGWYEDESILGNGKALSGFPFFHMAGTFFCLNCLYLAYTQILIPNPRDTEQICKDIDKNHPNVIVNVPSLYEILLKNPMFSTLDHSSVELCISSASPFPLSLQKRLEMIVGEGKLLELYGTTETSPIVTINPMKKKRKLGSIGLPILNTELKLVDPTSHKLVKIGEVGEICVRGPMVMKGYYNDPKATKEVVDRYGYLRTGDLAIMDDEGYIRLVGLKKDLIVVSGKLIYSKNVENAMIQHQAIKKIGIIGIPDPNKGNSELIKAFIQLDPIYKVEDYEYLKEDILKFCRAVLSPTETPSIIEFMKKLPTDSRGKVNKKVLKAMDSKKVNLEH